MNIRPANAETDIPGIQRVVNNYESYPVTTDEISIWLLERTPGREHLRLVAEEPPGAIVGYGVAVHDAWNPAGQFYAWAGVLPANLRRGVGSALWEMIWNYLREQGAERVVSEVRDSDPEGLSLARREGFIIERHVFTSHLDLQAFDSTPYHPLRARLQDQGLRFCALSDFPVMPEIDRKLCALNYAIVQDVPGETWDKDRYPEFFEKRILNASWFRRDGQLLAIDGDSWVGLAGVSLSLETQEAFNTVTGVLRSYRGRQIATVLKVLAARYARREGALSIGTNNDSLNAPILAVNTRLGYRPQAGRYKLIRYL